MNVETISASEKLLDKDDFVLRIERRRLVRLQFEDDDFHISTLDSIRECIDRRTAASYSGGCMSIGSREASSKPTRTVVYGRSASAIVDTAIQIRLRGGVDYIIIGRVSEGGVQTYETLRFSPVGRNTAFQLAKGARGPRRISWRWQLQLNDITLRK